MPGMNGGEVAKILRRQNYAGRIVGLTGNTMSEQRDAFLKCGTDRVEWLTNRTERPSSQTHHHAGFEELFTPFSQLALFVLRKSPEQLWSSSNRRATSRRGRKSRHRLRCRQTAQSNASKTAWNESRDIPEQRRHRLHRGATVEQRRCLESQTSLRSEKDSRNDAHSDTPCLRYSPQCSLQSRGAECQGERRAQKRSRTESFRNCSARVAKFPLWPAMERKNNGMNHEEGFRDPVQSKEQNIHAVNAEESHCNGGGELRSSVEEEQHGREGITEADHDASKLQRMERLGST